MRERNNKPLEHHDKNGKTLQVGDWVLCRDNYGFGKIIKITEVLFTSSKSNANFCIQMFNSPNLPQLNFNFTSLTKISEDEAMLMMLEN